MQFVQCENPKCRKYIEVSEAHVIKNDEGWQHYSCKTFDCMARLYMIEGILLHEEKVREKLSV